MSYLPDDVPLPEPGPDDRPYWEFCYKRELRIQCCKDCSQFQHPPMPFCGACGGGEIEWKQVSGKGRLFTFAVARYATHPALKSVLPYNIAVVMLDDAKPVRLVTNIVDAAPDALRIDMPLTLIWEPIRDGGFVPRFKIDTERA